MKKNNLQCGDKRGAVMLITVLMFLVLGVIMVVGLSFVVTKDLRNTSSSLQSKMNYFVSEAATEDVLYRLKNGVTVTNTTILSIGSSTATTTISDVGNAKVITTESGDVNNLKKHVQAKVILGSGVAFNYGIQVGNGGLNITGGSSITGNVYSNGSIMGGAGIHINGSAIAASAGPGIFVDQFNTTPTIPPYSISFNVDTTKRDFAQSFTSGTTSAISKISLYIKKAGSPGNFTVNLKNDNSGVPGTTILSTASLNASLVSTNYGWVDMVFASNPTLVSGTKYWVTITGTAKKNSTDYYTVGANSAYASGDAKLGTSGGVWNATTPSGLDGYFQFYVGNQPSQIKGYEGDYLYVGTTANDIAWAPSITFIRPSGKIYCQTATNIYGGKTCDAGSAAKGNPPALPMPVSQSNIDDWHAEALAGGTYTGDYAVHWNGAILGPKVITGNLTVDGGGTLTLTGTVWVKGYITVSGGGRVALSSSYGHNSGIIITDKYANISGDGQFSGSGTVGSYPVIVSSSICPNTTPCAANNSAISLTGGSGAVVLTAPFGKVNVVGGSACKAINGDSVYISGGGNVTYETGIADMSFKSGPSGGYEITSWKETIGGN